MTNKKMTHEELKKWHEDKNNFLQMDIALSGDDISDVIYAPENGGFINCVTGDASDSLAEVIRPKKKFVIMPEGLNTEGFRVIHDKEHDMLIIVWCSGALNNEFSENPSWKWTETKRMYASFNYGKYGNFEELDYLCGIDICGQAFYNSDMDENEFLPYNCYSNAKEQVMSYIGGFDFRQCDDDIRPSIYTFDDLIGYMFIFDRIYNDYLTGKRTVGGILSVSKEEKIVFDSLPIPKSAQNVLNRVKDLWVADMLDETSKGGFFEDILPCVSIIQRVDDKMVLRAFTINVHVKPNCEKTKMEFLECFNIVLDDAAENLSNHMRYAMTIPYVVWMDSNVEGTVLERYGYMIKDKVRILEAAMDDNFCWSGVTSDLVGSVVVDDYSLIDIRYTVPAAVDLGSNNVLERLFNLCNDKEASGWHQQCYSRLKERLMANVKFESVTERIEGIFGKIDMSKTKLDDILMFPKSMVQFLITSSYGLDIMHYLKMPFLYSKETIEYFKRLDKESWKTLYSCMSSDGIGQVSSYHTEWGRYADTLKMLMEIYGYKNWKSYAQHMTSLATDYRWNDWSDSSYSIYIKTLYRLGPEIAKKADWKLSGDDLKKASYSMKKILENIENEQFQKVFAENHAKTDKWLYEDDKYKIVVPETMADIVNEGLALRHCVKDFIPMIIDEKTMIFFIRKKGEEDMPFFTLEIKDNQIRQCHGFGNEDADSYGEGLDVFLENFCKAKNIPVSVGNKRLRAED